MKMTDEELHIAIHDALQDCIEHYLLYKAFYEYIDKTMVLDEKMLLAKTCNAHIQMCYTIWCKVFGGEQTTHYETVVNKNTFLERLEVDYGITASEFEKYASEARRFRNKYVAHTEKAAVIVPVFDMAKKAIITLDIMLDNNVYGIPFGTIEGYCAVTDGKYRDIVAKMVCG